jgi:GalNAc-alpha-(1->4)-GalNAc-alpha-(1->3)-diNAcBac-PP-undecaprenol alpha-1,4-N-acetyl-D-galactosaminyltransferase
MRATLIIGNLGSGGAERNLVRLAQGLAERGLQVSLMTLNRQSKDFYPVSTAVHRIATPEGVDSSPRWYDWQGQRRKTQALRNAIVASRPDVVISFIDTCNVQVLKAMRSSGIAVVVSERTDWRFHRLNWRWRLLRRLLYPMASAVVSVSKAPMQEALQYWPRWALRHIPNPVPKPPISPPPLPVWGSPCHVLAMGRLSPEKGFDTLIRAFARCAPNRPQWDLTILGEGPLSESLRRLAKELGVSDRVHLPGAVSEPTPYLRASEVFVLSSHYEAFPNALAEAMACGLAVVSFDCPSGPADMINHAANGWLVPARNEPLLASAMAQLMDDGSLRARLGQEATSITDLYAPEKIIDRWVALVTELRPPVPAKEAQQ